MRTFVPGLPHTSARGVPPHLQARKRPQGTPSLPWWSGCRGNGSATAREAGGLQIGREAAPCVTQFQKLFPLYSGALGLRITLTSSALTRFAPKPDR